MSELRYENLNIYKSANEIGDMVWEIVSTWNYFEKTTLGKQLVRSADSISLNICEGYGRYYFKDKRLFYYYSRGSLYETHEGIKKAFKRALIREESYNILSKKIIDLGVRLNNFIKVSTPGSK